jgi:Uncharacterized protein conserved in bacteria (DUF2237)
MFEEHLCLFPREPTGRKCTAADLQCCLHSFKPMTGFYRDGCCNTGQEDVGSHTRWQSNGLRGDDFGVSRLFEIARQRSFHTSVGIRLFQP